MDGDGKRDDGQAQANMQADAGPGLPGGDGMELPADPAAESWRLGLAAVLGAAAALAGAALWALIAIHGQVELGFLAWGIGLATGGVAVLSGAERGPTLGAIAAGCALVGLVAGKLLIVEWGADPSAIAKEWESNPGVVYACLVEDMAASGEISQDEVATLEALGENQPPPPAIVQKVQARHGALSAAEKTEMLERHAQNAVDQMPVQDRITSQLGGFDILWVLLALGSAWKLGKGTG